MRLMWGLVWSLRQRKEDILTKKKKKKIQLHESNIYIWSDTFVLFAPYVRTLHVKEKL